MCRILQSLTIQIIVQCTYSDPPYYIIDWALFYRSLLEFFPGLYGSFGAFVFNFVEICEHNISQKSSKIFNLSLFFEGKG